MMRRTGKWLAILLLAAIAVGTICGCGATQSADSAHNTASGATPKAVGSASPHPMSPSATGNPPMKTIGIIGGVSWVSSVEYYRLMNEAVRDMFGPDYSAKILMYSIPFGEFSAQERLAAKGDWRLLDATMIDAAARLQRGGADFIVIASNTMNSTADLLEEKVHLPVLRIMDAVGQRVQQSGIQTVVLLGTKHTMEASFYRDRLEQKFGLTVVTPTLAERNYINKVIFDELCAGKFKRSSRRAFVRIINRLVKEEGAQGVILGCTEIPLLVKQKDVSVPVFDSTAIHCEAAVRYSLGEE